MSGIFAASVGHDDAGIRSESERILARSRSRGADGTKVYVVGNNVCEILESKTTPRLSRPIADLTAYRLLGCCYSRQAISDKSEEPPPFISDDGSWIVTVDGTLVGTTGQQLADAAAKRGWTAVASELKGSFAVVAIRRSDPTLFWAASSKPLYALHSAYGRVNRIASQKEFFNDLYHPVRSPQPLQLGPYGFGELSLEGQLDSCPYDMLIGEGSLLLCGGGLDSVVAAWSLLRSYPKENLTLLYVDYAAKSAPAELAATMKLAASLNMQAGRNFASVKVIEFDFFRDYTDSSLTTSSRSIELSPQRGVASEWVPARNTVLMSLALAYAESHGLARIATGINQDAAAAYPDNDQEWLYRWSKLVPFSLSCSRTIELLAPLGSMSKTEIVKLGKELKLPWFECGGWSCYENGNVHCGECSSCRARKAAFQSARVADPTRYVK